jgi:hypothetical protein
VQVGVLASVAGSEVGVEAEQIGDHLDLARASGPAPMPIVGMLSRLVISAASCSGTSSSTTAKAPARWTARASRGAAGRRRASCLELDDPQLVDRLRRQTDVAHHRDTGTDDRFDRARAAFAAFELHRSGTALAHQDAGVLEAASGVTP